MEHGTSRSSNSNQDRPDQKLCLEKLMLDIAGLKRDLNEKCQLGPVLREKSSVLNYDAIQQSRGQPPSYAKAQRDSLLEEYAAKVKSVTTCASKNSSPCKICKILLEFVIRTNYALRYRTGKLKKRQSQTDNEMTVDGPVEPKRKPLGPNIELRLDTANNFESCNCDDDFPMPNDMDLVNVVLMSVADNIAKSGQSPNDMVLVEDLHIVTTQYITKTEQKRIKKMQTMLQSANQKDLQSIHREIHNASQYFNDSVLLQEYATNYLLGQPNVPKCLQMQMQQYLHYQKTQRYSPF